MKHLMMLRVHYPISLSRFITNGVCIQRMSVQQRYKTMKSHVSEKNYPVITLEKQLNFLREIDRLKSVVRQSPLLDKSRKENSAEHSWHLTVYVLLLNEYASGVVDTHRVIKILLLHDVVEIDVGDFPNHGGFSCEFPTAPERRGA